MENYSKNIIDGRALALALNENTAARLKQLSFVPLLCDIVVGDDAASLSYVRIKQQTAEKVGLQFRAVFMPANSSNEEVIAKIAAVQTDPNLCGLIVQLPLPKNLDKAQILSAIDLRVDVDVINPHSIEQFYSEGLGVIPPTAGAVLHILDTIGTENNIDWRALNFVVAGQGELVGKPTTFLLRARGYNVQTISIDTEDAESIMRSGDVIISGMGQPNLITSDIVKDGVIIIDAGTSESEGAIKGDADVESVIAKAKFVTPTPGGVGPVTVAKLLENVVIVGENKPKT